MDWVLIIIGSTDVMDGNVMTVATAQFETKELCETVASWLRENVKQGANIRPLVGVCFPATTGAQ